MHALQSHDDIPSLLAALLQHSTALSVRGRAAVLLAVLDAPATRQHFSQVRSGPRWRHQRGRKACACIRHCSAGALCSQGAEAMWSLLHLLLECSAGEGADFAEACWALTGAAARHLDASTSAVLPEACTH